MRVRVDRQTDAVYLNLTDATIEASEEVADGIVVDYDSKGRIVGVEILDASRRTGDQETLQEMSFELPGAASRQDSLKLGQETGMVQSFHGERF